MNLSINTQMNHKFYQQVPIPSNIEVKCIPACYYSVPYYQQSLMKYEQYNKNISQLFDNQLSSFCLLDSNFNQQQQQINLKKSKKFIYGNGAEVQKLKNLPHFGEKYKKCEMYLMLGKPEKKEIISLGEKYNDHFSKEIKDGIYPKFGRNQKRNMSLAVWFFEDHKKHIIPWLKQTGIMD